MILKTILLIYILCGCGMCLYFMYIIDKVGGIESVYSAAKVLDPETAEQLEKFDLSSPKIMFVFTVVIVLLWPIFVSSLFNRY